MKVIRKVLIAGIALMALVLLLRPFWLPIVFIPNLLVENKVRPLEWITAPPEISTVDIPHNNISLSTDIYNPRSQKTKQALLLIHGANEVGKNDQRIINFGQSLARTGIITIVPTFPDILRSSFHPQATDQIETMIQWMRQQYPDQDIGMVSFSVAGVPMYRAANELNQHFGLLLSFGSHYDLKNVLKYATTKTFEFENQTYTNEPDPFAKELLREQYNRLFGSDEAIEALFANSDPEKFEELYGDLRPEIKQLIAELSLTGLTNRPSAEKILIIHSEPDLIIPHTEALRLQGVISGQLFLLQSFSHVNIQFPELTFDTLFDYYFPQAGKLYKIIFQIL
jgi:hypothetical protein